MTARDNIGWEELEHVPDDLQAVHIRLLNWAQWASRWGVSGRCGSAERMYRAPWRQWHVPAMNPSVDTNDAVAVEKAVVRLDYSHKAILRLWYVRRAPVMRICRELVIVRSELPDRLNAARRKVWHDI